jgi:DHA2 family multidrug resistance protein
VLGIVGVILGAGIVTLTGRLLSLGLADLKGNVGIGFDDGAWISSAYNVALMFIGPFSVYLGGLLGPRKVLLYSAAVFTGISAFLPLVHSYVLLIDLLAIAGLTSGTFYPLTLTFALRNIPLRYLALVVALYATCIEAAVNFAPSIYGFCRNDLSWQWMFWIPAVLTPAMMACIFFGIPPSPKSQSKKQPPSFAGFFYLSAGFALLFAALDQGQRLDWWRSGTFTALFASGMFLLLCSLSRRLRSPNFLVDLPYLRQWNTILLAVALFSFRFALLATIIIIPQSLSVRGLDAQQFGPSVLWTAIFELFLAFVGALLLYRGFDSRLLMAIGFTAVAFACLLNSNFTSAWAPENYFRSELLMGVGPVVRDDGAGLLLDSAGVFFGRPGGSPTGAHLFSVFSQCAIAGRSGRRRDDGPLHCRARTTSLEPFGLTCAIWFVGDRWHVASVGSRALHKVGGTDGCQRPRCGDHWQQVAAASL